MKRREHRQRSFEDGATGFAIVDIDPSQKDDHGNELETELYVELDRVVLKDGWQFRADPEFMGLPPDGWRDCRGYETQTRRQYDACSQGVTQEGRLVSSGFVILKAPTLSTSGHSGMSIQEAKDLVTRLTHAIEMAEEMDKATGSIVMTREDLTA